MTTTFLSVANNATSTLAKGAALGALEVELISGGHASFPATVPFNVSIDKEILHVTKVTGDVFTVERAAEGTAAEEHLTGAAVELHVTAKSVSDLNKAVNEIEEGTTDLTAYLRLAGRSGGQVARGDTAAKGNLTLESTSNAEKGKILGSNWALDEANTRFGIGTTSPSSTLTVTAPAEAASATTPGKAAPNSVTVSGGAGGETTATGKPIGGKGASISFTAGPGGGAPNGTESATGGAGGTTLLATPTGVAVTASCTGLVKGGVSGGVTLSTGAGGAGVNSGAGTAEGAGSGTVEVVTGKGGAGTTKPGPSGGVKFKTGAPGAFVPGAEGNTGPITFEVGNANGTGKAGNITLGGGLGGTEGTGSEILLKTGKEAATNKIQITQSGMAFFGATAVAQAAAITKMVKKEGEPGVTAELIEKVNQLVKSIAAAEGGIGVSA